MSSRWRIVGNGLSSGTLVALALLAVGLRIAYMIALQSWNFSSDWAFGYEMGRLGESLARDEGFLLGPERPTAKFPPLYPLIVAAAFKVFGAYSASAAVGLFLFQIVCSGVVTVLLAQVGARVFGPRAGLTAGLIWAIYPTSFFFSSLRIWYTETALLLLVVIVAIAITGGHGFSIRRSACLGAVSGLLVLTDSTMSLYLVLLGLWVSWRGAMGPAGKVARLGVWGVVALVVISPWLVRNWTLFGSPLVVKSNFGQELVIGNAPHLDLKGEDRPESEIQYQRLMRDRAFGWIRQHPDQFARRTLERFLYFWVGNPKFGAKFYLRFAYFTPLLLLSLVGLERSLRQGCTVTPLWLFLLVYPLPYYVTHVHHGRYIYPVEPFVVLLAAVPLATILASWLGPQRKPAARSG